MGTITIQKLTPDEISDAGIRDWPIWEKEVSRFDWIYDMEEHCYILEGNIIVETDDEKVSIKKGDYVIFPKGLTCIWDIKADVRKHYKFS